ncbi:MAG: serine/threonine protein kinase [Myxococcaceae bacterium]|nr:serine/threonine protein kinase [Myxococcaceae bacterium]MEA2748288.1 eukaryotic-like serine/threonine-protein kinase [Myxococcales bacterium]
MGIVYLAVAHGPARFSKLLVVKELKPELVEDGNFLEMFLEEARLAARLSHPNIVQTYEIGAEGNRHYMVMDYLEGVTLARTLRKKSEKFTLAMQLRIMCEILQGLDYAHSLKDFDGTPLGIVHRDATPQNVFITFDGTVKLVDFGIAKALDSTVETRTGVLKGKPAYMAPEQIGGDVDPRADVFAVGVMVWEAIVGHRMWHKKGDVEVLTNIIKGQIPTLKETKPDAPEQLIRICDRALAKNREDRYPTAADFQADLEAYLVASKTEINSREVGKVIGELFATERTTTRSTIEQHIASLKSGKAVEKLPSLRPAQVESSTTPSGVKPGSMKLADPPSFTPASLQSIVTGGGTPGGTEMPSGASDALAKELAAKKQKTTIGIAIGAGAVLLIGIAALRVGTKSAAVAEPAATKVAAAPVPEAAPVPTSHEVALRVNPPNALISIEGVPLSNPGKRTCTHGQRIMMHASAAHFVSTDRELNCERDESIELSLQPEPTVAMPNPPAATFVATPWVPPGRKAPPPPPPPAVVASKAPAESAVPPKPVATPPAAKPGEISPTGGTRPNRAIDTANPYGNQ